METNRSRYSERLHWWFHRRSGGAVLRRKPAEGAAGQVDAYRAQAADFGRADARRGVGAKEAIHEAIKDYVNQGCAIILISSDLMELMGLSDRILILNHGRVNLIMDKDECTEETLLLAANGGCCDE